MDTHAYPGKGLSLPQLSFALKEELNRAAYSPSFTFDDISQLDRDISTALANIREWRNSFIHINRLPSDVLSFIPTHLDSQADRFSASYVCRHWRRTFLQYAALWSRVFLPRCEVYVRTLLERAKGSALDVITDRKGSAGTITLLSPHTQQIRSFSFMYNHWTGIREFSDVISGPLPLLRTLEINVTEDFPPASQSSPPPPPRPLFSNAINLKQFVLRFEMHSFLNHFVFPNLTTFELSTTLGWGEFRASELLNFLEASPMLQTIHMKILASILLEDVAQRGVVVLPNVQTFSLVMDDGGPAYELVAQISCPSASHTSLIREKFVHNFTTDDDIRDVFPAAASWNAIVRQYTRSPVESISLEMKTLHNPIISCTLTFRSPDATIIRLGLEVLADLEEFDMSLEVLAQEFFSQASRTVRDYPLLHSVKYLHILHSIRVPGFDDLMDMVTQVGRLFKSVGPLEELVLHGCDLHTYLTPFLNLPGFEDTEQLIAFPPIKKLTISHPSMVDDEEECMAAIVELAKSQNVLGVPFECVTVRARQLPTGMREMLEPWVGVADCCEERDTQIHDE